MQDVKINQGNRTLVENINNISSATNSVCSAITTSNVVETTTRGGDSYYTPL
ncbi:MAG: hypothetical protein FWG85_00635 [Bacteroidetes bacterium]|nr:hypothetical protein [Bacteroidota bacterium]